MALSKKIKVCFVILKAYPLFNPSIASATGGAEVDLYLLSKALARDPLFDVSFVLGDYGQAEIEVVDNVTLIKSVNVNQNLILGGYKIWKALKQVDADVYMSECSSLGISLYRLFCRVHQKKFVYRTAHTNECDGTYIKKSWIKGMFFKNALRKSDVVLTQNISDKKSLYQTTGVSAEVVKNCCDIPEINVSAKSGALWVARSASFKRPTLFFKLAKQYSQYQFTMICEKAFGDTQYDQLQKDADALENIDFISHVCFNEIDNYFAKARVFVSTSESEGFPNTFVHAAKCSTPILSLMVNPDQFLDKHKCGWCANDDWNRFATLFADVMNNENELPEGANGKKYIEDNHDIDHIIERYKEIFKALVV